MLQLLELSSELGVTMGGGGIGVARGGAAPGAGAGTGAGPTPGGRIGTGGRDCRDGRCLADGARASGTTGAAIAAYTTVNCREASEGSSIIASETMCKLCCSDLQIFGCA